MRRLPTRLLAFALICLLAGFTAACSTGGDDDTDDDGGDDGDDDGFVYPYCGVDEQAIELILRQMSPAQKVAQMYIVGVQVLPGWAPSDTRRMIQSVQVGGVFVQALTGVGFWPEWTAENMNTLQEMALSREIPVPLLVTVDQEGGIAQALNSINGGTDQPGNLGLGATFDPNMTYLSYRIMGEQLAAVGINVAFAPVLGLMTSHEETSMYTRCFGELSSEVAGHAVQAIRGFQENLVVATAKHFPGHSTAPGDEHFVLPVNDKDEQTVRDLYLPPFAAAIDAGTDMMMTTHAVFSALDELPGTFSYRIMTELLRQEMGFMGVLVTDDINMGSVTNNEWNQHPDVLAIGAGADMIVDCGTDSEPGYGIAPGNEGYAFDVEGQIQAVLEAVMDGRLSMERIDQSVRRILRLKMKYCLFEDPYVDVAAAAEHSNTPEQIGNSTALHEKAITLVRNDQELLPLDPVGTRIHAVCPHLFQWEMYPDAAWGNIAGTDLLEQLRQISPSATGDRFNVDPFPIAVSRVVANARNSGADVLVVGTYNAMYYPMQWELIRQLLDLGMPTILVATAMPYDLLAFPDASTYLATYSNRDIALQTAARAIFGEVDPAGRLPVSLPGLYEMGWSANR